MKPIIKFGKCEAFSEDNGDIVLIITLSDGKTKVIHRAINGDIRNITTDIIN